MKTKKVMLFMLFFALGLAGCNEVSSESSSVSSEPNSSPSIEDSSSSKESITPSIKPSEPSITPSEPVSDSVIDSSESISESSEELKPEKVYISISDLDKDTDESVYLVTYITGKVNDKIYIESDGQAFEIDNVPIVQFSKCRVGDKVEIELSIQNGIIETKYIKMLSANNKVSDAISLDSLADLQDNLYRKVNIPEVEIIDIEGNIFKNNQEARITISDGINETVVFIPEGLGSTIREGIAKSLSYPIVGDKFTFSNVFVTESDGVAIELSDKKQASYIKAEEVVNPFGNCTPINQIMQEGEYSSRGKVVASSNTQFILMDETGGILVYSPYASSVEVGKYYEIEGDVVVYGEGLEYKNILSPIEIDPIEKINENESIYFDNEFLTNVSNMNLIPCSYIEITGKLEQSGKYTNLILDGFPNYVGSINTSMNLTNYYNKNVVIKGYFTGISASRYIQIVTKEISLAENQQISPTSLEIKGCKDEIEYSDFVTLSTSFIPENSNHNKKVTWSIDDESIATIDFLGRISVKKPGTITVTATSQNGISSTKQITILPQKSKINAISISSSEFEIGLGLNEEYAYKVATIPANATNLQYIDYSIADESIAYINSRGNLVGKKYGRTFIDVVLYGGNSISIPVFVEPTFNLGYETVFNKENKEYQVVSSIEDLRKVFIDASMNQYRTIYIDFNLSKEIDFERLTHSLEEWAYLGNGIGAYDIDNNESLYPSKKIKDQKVEIHFSWLMKEFKDYYETSKGLYGAVEAIPYIPNVLKKNYINSSGKKRPSDFEDFPIVKENNGYMDVYNDVQLWWVLQYDYLPNFVIENSMAEYIYEEAKAILREIITDDMSEIEKCKAIFDYVCERNTYAKDYFRSGQVAYNAPEQSMVAIFQRGRSVCEAYAKLMTVLARIEGIEMYYTTGVGHAWNSVKIDGKYYSICATLADKERTIEEWASEHEINYSYGIHSYRNFLCVNDDFLEYSYNPDYGFSYGLDKIEFSYVDNILSIDKLPGTEYDYIVNDEAELDAIMKQVTDLNLKGKSYIVLCDGGYSISQEHIQKSLNKAGYKGKFDCGVMFERLNGSYDYYVIVFNN